MGALELPIARERRPLSLAEFSAALDRIMQTVDRLVAHAICPIGFCCTRQGGPVVTVCAHPYVYALYPDAETIGRKQIGVLCHITYTAADPTTGVQVIWEEVACRA